MVATQKTQLNFKGTYFFNKTQKRDFHSSPVIGTFTALSNLRKYLKNYQQTANVRLSYNKKDEFIKMSTTGKANRYAHGEEKITIEEMAQSENLSKLLIEKANNILDNAGLIIPRKNPAKKQKKFFKPDEIVF